MTEQRTIENSKIYLKIYRIDIFTPQGKKVFVLDEYYFSSTKKDGKLAALGFKINLLGGNAEPEIEIILEKEGSDVVESLVFYKLPYKAYTTKL